MPTDNQPAALVPVTFLVQHQRYNAGETAGFEPQIAVNLVKSGAAVPYNPKAKKAEAPAKVQGSPNQTRPNDQDGDQPAKRKDTRKRDRKAERARKRAEAEARARGEAGEQKATKGALARLQREAPEGAAEAQEPEAQDEEGDGDGVPATA